MKLTREDLYALRAALQLAEHFCFDYDNEANEEQNKIDVEDVTKAQEVLSRLFIALETQEQETAT